MPGLSTVTSILDCSNLAIYNPGTQTLTLNQDTKFLIGRIELINAAGISITEIVNLSEGHPTTIYNDNGTTTFNSVALAGPPAANGIVSPNGNFAYNVKFNANCVDFITFTKEGGTLNVVENAVIIT